MAEETEVAPELPQPEPGVEQAGQTAPAPGAIAPIQPLAPGGLSAADTFAQVDGVFKTPSLRTLYAFVLGRYERDLARTQGGRDAAVARVEALQAELGEMKATNRVLKVRLDFATGLQRSQALLYVLGGAVLGVGLGKLPATEGFVSTVAGLILVVIAWGMKPPKE